MKAVITLVQARRSDPAVFTLTAEATPRAQAHLTRFLAAAPGRRLAVVVHLAPKAARTCVNGHPRSRANTYTDPKGRHRCRVCQRATEVRYEAKRKAARRASRKAARS